VEYKRTNKRGTIGPLEKVTVKFAKKSLFLVTFTVTIFWSGGVALVSGIFTLFNMHFHALQRRPVELPTHNQQRSIQDGFGSFRFEWGAVGKSDEEHDRKV
jgi:hypothetical protein